MYCVARANRSGSVEPICFGNQLWNQDLVCAPASHVRGASLTHAEVVTVEAVASGSENVRVGPVNWTVRAPSVSTATSTFDALNTSVRPGCVARLYVYGPASEFAENGTAEGLADEPGATPPDVCWAIAEFVEPAAAFAGPGCSARQIASPAAATTIAPA